MFRTICVLVLTLFVATASAADKQPFTVDDVYRVEQITDFKISPNGEEAVYVRQWYDASSPRLRTALWRIDGKTGRRAPLEAGEPDARMPVFSQDGRWLAFVSTRRNRDGEVPYVEVPEYSEPIGGIWAIERTESAEEPGVAKLQSKRGMQAPTDTFYARLSFGPDGRTLLAAIGDMPDITNLLQRRDLGRGVPDYDDQGDGYEGLAVVGYHTFPVTAHLQHQVNRQKSNYLFNWYGDPQWLPRNEGVVCHVNFSDDEESVRYSINKNYDLWVFNTDHKTDKNSERQLTTNEGPDVSPRVSPDGKHVLYLSVPRKGPHSDVYNLCVVSTADDELPKPRIIVNAHDAERDADGTPPFQPSFPLRDDCWIDAAHVRVTGIRGTKTETMVFNIAGPEAPISADAKPEPAPHANPHFKKPEANPWLAERHVAPQELVRWKSFDGLEIEGVLTLPPAELTQFKKPYPVIVNPHGGPHGISTPGFNIGTQVFASAGYAVFQPNYRGSTGYGRKFLDAARFDMGGSDMQDILTGVDALIERGVVDKERQYVYGSSYGGYTASRLVTLTDRFQAVVAQNPVTDLHAMWRLSDLQSWTEWEFGGKPWETVERDGKQIDVAVAMRDRSPTTHAHKVKTPVLLLHADHDRRCPLAMSQMFYRLLIENDCDTELIIYRDERHQILQLKHQADVVQRVLDWFAAYGE